MSILAVSAGVVTAVRGEAFIRSPQGDLVPVKVGDTVQPGQVILGPTGEVIETTPTPAARPVDLTAEVDQAIANLDAAPNEEDAPAAGLTGGDGASLGQGLRVDRVSESVSPQAFASAGGTIADGNDPLAGALTDQRPLATTEAEPPAPPAPPASLPFLVVFGQDAVEGQASEFTVTLTQAPANPVTVRLELLPGSDPVDAATPGVDTAAALEYFNTVTQQWAPVTGDLTFAAGQTAIQVRVATMDDTEVEGVEFIQLKATVVSGETANSFNSNDAAITDNDKPYLVVYGQDAVEGQPVGFTVNLTQPSPGPVTVKLDLLAGSDPTTAATPDVDTLGPLEFFNSATQQWEAVTGDLTFAASETQLQVRVATFDDTEIEGVEFIQLKATVTSGETANPFNSNDAAVTDNDKPYMVVYATDAIEGEAAHFTVNLTSAAADVVAVTLALQPADSPSDAAQPGLDSSTDLEFFNVATQQWEAVSGPLSFQPGETQIEVRVVTLEDMYTEPVEYLRLQATVVQGEVMNPVNWNDVAITDNEGRAVTGTSGDDDVLGQAGNDALQGLAGDDVLIGGRGDDRLNGDDGSDVFAWRLSDVVNGHTTVDSIEDFDVAAHAAGGDVLDLRDLLQGEHTDGGTGNLTQYLHFDTSGANTLIQISVNGDLVNGQGSITQEIVLEGVNLRTDMGLDAGAGDGLVIAKMLADHKLWVDAA
ncbi:MAG: type I secretion C-terminal target domain-containing protein [Aquabacterium sp.]|jgi:hypothetical protein|uniref:type I secretion C-terminal target domain-containing protein n=1 Tax=Aquabacterium sp. TaxID=1872578 RepID=UPI002A3662B6|nr:type I secretion C-terminal target domain-containing protein [Aquabacterium sp.]MDX9842786.1 type I secretion C-terminal target domain-containing protein [Aquabacterium sp.]